MYKKVIADDPTFITPDVLKKEKGLQQLLRHPISYIKFLGFMNTNTEKLLKKYPDKVYMTIIGFVAASLITLI